MKRVATITYSWSQNWGAILQTYALNEFLVRSGYPAEIINYRNFDEKIINTVKSVPDGISCLLHYGQGKKRIEKFNEFRSNVLRLTECKYLNEEELRAVNDQFDVFITGSDQIWNIGRGVNRNFYLHFADDSKTKLSYAGSFGVSEIPPEHREATLKGLKNLDHISVREESGARIVESFLGVTPSVVVDPVFLLSGKQWEEVCDYTGADKPRKPYIFVYPTQVTPLLKETVRYYRKKYHWDVISPFYIGTGKVRKDIGPLEFVSLIRNARLVIGSSFHALAFSLIFEKDFLVIPHTSTGSRVRDLATRLNLSDRIITESDSIAGSVGNVDYSEARPVIRKMISDSKEWLLNAIESGKNVGVTK